MLVGKAFVLESAVTPAGLSLNSVALRLRSGEVNLFFTLFNRLLFNPKHVRATTVVGRRVYAGCHVQKLWLVVDRQDLRSLQMTMKPSSVSRAVLQSFLSNIVLQVLVGSRDIFLIEVKSSTRFPQQSASVGSFGSTKIAFREPPLKT